MMALVVNEVEIRQNRHFKFFAYLACVNSDKRFVLTGARR
jgi:hypothetical protein